MTKVQFNDLDEFFEELAKLVEAKIVRVSTMSKESQQFPGVMYYMFVVAGVLNESGQVVELLVPCGDVVRGMKETPAPASERANELADKVRSRAQALGFDVRAGRFLAAEAAPC